MVIGDTLLYEQFGIRPGETLDGVNIDMTRSPLTSILKVIALLSANSIR